MNAGAPECLGIIYGDPALGKSVPDMKLFTGFTPEILALAS
jgi:hypothetical protein